MVVEQVHTKEEVIEEYDANTNYSTKEDVHVTYIYHADGSRTEQKTVTKTQYEPEFQQPVYNNNGNAYQTANPLQAQVAHPGAMNNAGGYNYYGNQQQPQSVNYSFNSNPHLNANQMH